MLFKPRELRRGLEEVVLCRLEPGHNPVEDREKPPLEMIQQARMLLPGVPILVLSIHPEDVYALRVLKAGASGYLTKDSASDELIRAVRTLLKGKRFLSDNLADRLACVM